MVNASAKSRTVLFTCNGVKFYIVTKPFNDMGLKERYERAKEQLLHDPSICKENRELFKAFFEFEEYKLKRQNAISRLDEPCYKTLSGYVGKFKNVNTWFRNKPWRDLTKQDIKKVYDDLEDGKITNRSGKKFEDRAGYYGKIFKSKPFRMVGKSEIAKDVMEFTTGKTDKEVRYVIESEFKKLVSVVSKPKHLLLFWLQWDVGENINTSLQLTKKDFMKQKNPRTNEPEYLVNLPKDKIKRSRKTRSEPTLYAETVKYADMVLEGLGRNEPIFAFGHRQSLKIMQSAVKRSGAVCMPNNDSPTWKDLRSGMACHLLKSGWTREEVNARLGHTPSSDALNAYLTFLAIDRHGPKHKLFTTSLEAVQNELEDFRAKSKLEQQRMVRLTENVEQLRGERIELRNQLKTQAERYEDRLNRVMKYMEQSEQEQTKMQKQHQADMKILFTLIEKKLGQRLRKAA